MSKALVPCRFVDATNLDVEDINDDIEAIAGDVNRSLSRRYTYSTQRWDVSGVADTSTQDLRTVPIRRPGTNNVVEIIGVEVVIYGDGNGDVWTLLASDASVSLSLTTVSGTEVAAISPMASSPTSATSDRTFILSCSTTSTITTGYVLLHLRCDRWNQGNTVTPAAVSALNSESSTAGSTLDTILTALATSVTSDTSAASDLRCEVVMVRDLVAASSVVHRLPGGVRTKLSARLYSVQSAAGSIDVTIDGSTTSLTGSGITILATAAHGTFSGAAGTDPTSSADDTVVTIAAVTQTALMAAVVLWWS